MRIRWLAAQWPLPVRNIAQRMKINNFTNYKDDGFIVDRVRDKSVEGRYIEKFSFQEKVIDPFGNESLIDRVSYQTVDFILFDNFPNIEIINSPRSTNSYLNKLLEICDFDLAINCIDTDLSKWAGNFQSTINDKLTVDCIQINDLEFDFGIKAKILIKGDKDVSDAVSRFTRGKKYKIEKIQLRVPMHDTIVLIKLSSNGIANIPDAAIDHFLPLIRSTIIR